MSINALSQLDFYKVGHVNQYPEGTEYIYSNFTARSGHHSNVADSKGVYFVGLQSFISEYLINDWNDSFFNKPKEEVVSKFKSLVTHGLQHEVDCSHIEALHDLGYLPIKIKALDEGRFVPYKVPMMTIVNTLPEFYWITNALETVISAELWLGITSATTYKAYYNKFIEYADMTCDDSSLVPYQGHDFSFRGMGSKESAAKSAFAAIAMGSKGTDTIPGIEIAMNYYGAENYIAGSVNATEHSVMCAGSADDEIGTYRRLMNEVYPTGVLSIVSDTWDFWAVVSEMLPELKDEIMSREGCVVIRPDSGDPVDIICGIKVFDCGENADYDGESLWIAGYRAITLCGITKKLVVSTQQNRGSVNLGDELSEYEVKGLVECLWDIFGGNVNHKGYKVLDSHIGAIYGDSITLDRQAKILKQLKEKGLASSNIVLGIGSYTYQMVTRDTHGMAMKATSATVKGFRRYLFKDPKTDSGIKKSAKGLLSVHWENGKYVMYDQQTPNGESRGCLHTVFENGVMSNIKELSDVINNSNREKSLI